MKKFMVIASALIAVSGCNTLQEIADLSLQTTCNQTIETVDEFFSQHPDLEPEFKEAISESRVMDGMTKDMVAASWGSRADKIVLTGHTTWHWEYREPKGEWVSFSDAKVIDASTYRPMFFSHYKSCTQ